MKRQRYIVIGIIVAIAAIMVGGIIAILTTHKPSPSASSQSSTTNAPNMATQANNMATQLSSAIPTTYAAATAPSNHSTSPVTLTYAGWVAPLNAVIAGGYAATQETGTCTLTLTKGSQKVTTTTQSTQSAANSACGALNIPKSKLSSGKWTAVLTFSSKSLNGTSQPMNDVEVP